MSRDIMALNLSAMSRDIGNAEGVGFEPTGPTWSPTDFKSVTFVRSVIPPVLSSARIPWAERRKDPRGRRRGGSGIRTHEGVVTPYGISSAAH